MSRRRPRAPDYLPAWVSERPTTIYTEMARPGDPQYECVGGPMCGTIVVLRPPNSCIVPGHQPGPGAYPGIYVGCEHCGVMWFHAGEAPRSLLPCGHEPGDLGRQANA